MLLQAVGAAADPASGGRQMPSHWGSRKHNIFTTSSPTGTQFLQAVGAAEAGRYFNHHPAAMPRHSGDYREFKDVQHHADEVIYVSAGDGTTSQGEFWESLNTASSEKLPLLYVIEDNGYAISVPVRYQTPGGNISPLVANFPNFHFEECDGTDLLESLAAMRRAVEYVRSGNGPALVHGHVIRPYSHSLSDDEQLYRPESERKKDAERDPLHALAEAPDRRGHSRRRTPCRSCTAKSMPRCRPPPMPRLPQPSRQPSSYALHVYSERLKPTDAALRYSRRSSDGGDRTMADLINKCLRDEMQHDERIVIFGEDVADCSRERVSGRQEGEGQGRSVQAHQRAAARLRLGPRLQLAARRSQHRGPRHRHGGARAQAGGGDPVLRLHLAGHAPASQRAAADPLALQRCILAARR